MAANDRSPKKRRTDCDGHTVAQANTTARSFLRTKQMDWMLPGAASHTRATTTRHDSATAFPAPVNETSETPPAFDGGHDGARDVPDHVPPPATIHNPSDSIAKAGSRPQTVAPDSARRRVSLNPSTNEHRPGLPSPALSDEIDRFPSPGVGAAVSSRAKGREGSLGGARRPSNASPADTRIFETGHDANAGNGPMRTLSRASNPLQQQWNTAPPVNLPSNGESTPHMARWPPQSDASSLHTHPQPTPTNQQARNIASNPSTSTYVANAQYPLPRNSDRSGPATVPHIPVPSNDFARVRGQTAQSQSPIAHAPSRSADRNPLYRNPALMPSALRDRLDLVEADKRLQNRSQIDRGRLTLLRQAIEAEDWFYLVLSQIHCLSTKPDLLPTPAQSQDPQAFRGLDILFCPTRSVHPVLREHLCNFPLPILTLYSSPFTAQPYDSLVRGVVNFMIRLNGRWSKLVGACVARQSPPLVQDVLEAFGVQSRLIETAVFRAINRSIWVDELVIEQAEKLHLLDQNTWLSQPLRSPAQRSEAYAAFQRLYDCCKSHAEFVQVWSSRQQGSPPQFRMPQVVLAPFNSLAQGQHVRVGSNNNTGDIGPQQMVQQPQRQQICQQAQDLHRQRSFQQSQQQPQPVPSNNGGPFANFPTHPGGPANQTTAQPFAMQQQAFAPPVTQPIALPPPPPQHVPNPNLIFPHASEPPRAQPTHPNTTRSGLHQAHLRSPELRSSETDAPGPRFYRHVMAYALRPTRLNKDQPVNTITFTVPQSALDNLPRRLDSDRPGGPGSYLLSETTQTCRLRVCAVKEESLPSESDWITSDVAWPSQLYLDLNGHPLEARKKLHHGKNLPIDITSHIIAGENSITAFINHLSTDTAPFLFALAVEIAAVTSHDSLIQNVLTRTIPASTSRSAIQTSLACGKTPNSEDDDDDDVAITSNTLTINLFDPYSASKIFSIPVRGTACSHKDCFDLETFLLMCKRSRPADANSPTVVDCWRCPLCRGDVRPQNLVVDGLLVEVRRTLHAEGKLNTRAVVFDSDGGWKVKEEMLMGVRSPSLEAPGGGSGDGGVSSEVKRSERVVEVIELE